MYFRKHFTSWHGKFGLAASLMLVTSIIGGIWAKYSSASLLKKLIKPINAKLYHATWAMLTFLTAMTAVALATYSNWFKNRVGTGWTARLAFWAPMILAVCVARQVTQSWVPRVLTPRESELDAKARIIQEKVEAKLKKKKQQENEESPSERDSSEIKKDN